jgi:hypothetical protein
MGAWDATSFGNDTANDWAYDLEECDDLSHIEATLQEVLDTGDDFLDSDAAVGKGSVLSIDNTCPPANPAGCISLFIFAEEEHFCPQ